MSEERQRVLLFNVLDIRQKTENLLRDIEKELLDEVKGVEIPFVTEIAGSYWLTKIILERMQVIVCMLDKDSFNHVKMNFNKLT